MRGTSRSLLRKPQSKGKNLRTSRDEAASSGEGSDVDVFQV